MIACSALRDGQGGSKLGAVSEHGEVVCRHGSGERGSRHRHPGRQLQVHRPRRPLGPLCLQQHPQVPAVPVDDQHGRPHRCLHRRVCRQGAPQRAAAALGEPHHGHSRGAGARDGGPAREPAEPQAARPRVAADQPHDVEAHDRPGAARALPARSTHNELLLPSCRARTA